MNGIKVRYRGGPEAGRIEMLPPGTTPPNQTRLIQCFVKMRKPYVRLRTGKQVSPSFPRTKQGVYSRVYTPLKDGSILMVWVEQ